MHVHDHTHSHDHAHTHAANETRTLWASILTGAFMIVEAVGGLLSGSLALLADAGHMLTDFAALFFAWVSFRLSRMPADDQRTFGFHRLQILAAFANGLTLIFVAAWIVIEAVGRLTNPVEIASKTMMGIAVIGLVVNIVAFLILHGADQDNLNIRGAVLHVIGDMLGSVAAILAALVIMTTGWLPIDPLLSMLVAALIGRSALSLIRRSGHILLEGAPPHIDVRGIAPLLKADIAGLKQVHHIHVWCLTQDRVLATLHAQVDETADGGAIAQQIRDRLTTELGITHVTVEIEPS